MQGDYGAKVVALLRRLIWLKVNEPDIKSLVRHGTLRGSMTRACYARVLGIGKCSETKNDCGTLGVEDLAHSFTLTRSAVTGLNTSA